MYAAYGSSPLTRGKLVHFLSSHLLIRLIPAHAGKTRSGIPAPGRRRAHPRSRGENNRSSRQFLPVYGSSPLTRGKPLMRAVAADRIRLIPAHAGKTQAGGRPHAPGAAHPRSRGENPHAVAWKVWSGGSSPLTRGKHVAAAAWPARTRLIPAHAGKTHDLYHGCVPAGAHPRSRGENTVEAPEVADDAGSSPLTRGKRRTTRTRGASGGLIPAHAGKTMSSSSWPQHSGAHPRSRGENLLNFGSGRAH